MNQQYVIILITAVLVFSLPSVYADNIFLKIGDIKGESTDRDHKDWIDVLSVSFGASSSGSGETSGTRYDSTGRTAFSDISITKEIDKSSPKLFELVASGERIRGDVTLQKVTSEGTPYVTATLTNVIVSDYSIGGSEGSVPTESISLNYETINFSYNQLNSKGQVQDKVEAGWNVVENSGNVPTADEPVMRAGGFDKLKDKRIKIPMRGDTGSEYYAPQQQIKDGVAPTDVLCNEGLELIFKLASNSPSCVTPETAEKLIQRGWTSS